MTYSGPAPIANGSRGPSASAVVPPHSLDAEQSVLGAILLSDQSLYALAIEEGLQVADFYHERHGRIYEAMLSLYNESEPVDVLTVTERLKTTGRLEEVGGRGAVDELTGLVPAAGHARRYAQIVRENALLRRLLGAAYEIQSSVADHGAPPRDLVEHAEKAILEVARDDRKQDFRSIEDVLHDETDKLERLSTQKTSLTGTPSGFRDLDAITGGFQPGNLIIIAARPAMGKSALVCNIAENAAMDRSRPSAVALFSLEMSETELAQRFVASQAAIKGEELRMGKVKADRWPKILKASQRLAAAPMWVDDSSDLGLLELRAKARRLHNQCDGGLGLIVVDYLQLMRTDSRYDSRVTAVGELSRGLKILARELEVPVIAISQLSRAVEQRPDKRPMLSDLRESGNLEQDADLVAFIYRDDYYHEDSDRPGEADLLIAKHRNGALGRVPLTFQAEYPRFLGYEREQQTAGVAVGAASHAAPSGGPSISGPALASTGSYDSEDPFGGDSYEPF